MDILALLVLLQVINIAAIILAYLLGKISKIEHLLGWLRERSK